MDGNPLASADWKEIVGHLPLGWREAAESHGLCVSRLDADEEDRNGLQHPRLTCRPCEETARVTAAQLYRRSHSPTPPDSTAALLDESQSIAAC